jgi:hypothetical protein
MKIDFKLHKGVKGVNNDETLQNIVKKKLDCLNVNKCVENLFVYQWVITYVKNRLDNFNITNIEIQLK